MTMTGDEIARLRELFATYQAAFNRWWHKGGTDLASQSTVALKDLNDAVLTALPSLLAAASTTRALLAERGALKGQVEAMREALEEIAADEKVETGYGNFDEGPLSGEACQRIARSALIAALAAAGAKGGPDA